MKVNTHNEANALIERYIEPVLDKYGIVPHSPEDDERDEEDMGGLYGSAFSNVLDESENIIVDVLTYGGFADEAAVLTSKLLIDTLGRYGYRGNIQKEGFAADLNTELRRAMSLLDNETVKERGFVTDEYADEPNYEYVL